MGQLSRRGLIAMAAGGCAMRFGALVPSSDAAGRLADAHLLFAACSDLKCSEAIGMACLRALPAAETSRDVLASMIIQRTAPRTSDLNSSAEVRRLVRAQIREDFHTGAVKNVDGWILSLTETRVYALSALLAREGSPLAFAL